MIDEVKNQSVIHSLCMNNASSSSKCTMD